MSEEKFSKCEEGEKCFKCRISGVRKKKWKLKEQFREKNEVFSTLRKNLKWKILLSLHLLVGGVVLIEKFDHMSLIEKLEKFEVENFFFVAIKG